MSDHLDLVLVTGTGGFIGGILSRIFARGATANQGSDIKPLVDWYQRFKGDVENLSLDLNLRENCEEAARGASEISIVSRPTWVGWVLSSDNKALCILQC